MPKKRPLRIMGKTYEVFPKNDDAGPGLILETRCVRCGWLTRFCDCDPEEK